MKVTVLVGSLSLLTSALVPAQHPTHTSRGDDNEQLGRAVCGLGDIDADGVPDYAAGAPEDRAPDLGLGRVLVVSGYSGLPRFTLKGSAKGEGFGAALAACGDVNADGITDFLVGSPWDDGAGDDAGKVGLYSGKDARLLHTFVPDGKDEHFGYSVAGPGDITRDGVPDLVVGAPNAYSGGGAVYVFSGKGFTKVHKLVGGFGDKRFGHALCGLGDVDEDGSADFAIGVPRGLTLVKHQLTGYACIISGAKAKWLWTFTGTKVGANHGTSIAAVGDLNKDGITDLIVGSPGVEPNGPLSGAAIVYSSKSGAFLFSFPGKRSKDRHGTVVAGVGDVDADGIDDLAIAGAYRTGGRTSVHVHSGKTGAELYTLPRGRGDSFAPCYAVAALGDLNEDGHDDIVCGVPNSLNGGNRGVAYALSGKALSLWADEHTVRVKTTDHAVMTLEAGKERAGQLYLVLGSVSGTKPGLALGPVTLPLNSDAYTAFLVGNPNGLIRSSLGVLDATGKARPDFMMLKSIPHAMAGLVLHHAAIVFATDFSAVEFATNAAPLAFTPRY